MTGLVILAVLALALAWRTGSLNWLLVHLGVDVLIAWYAAMLWQLRLRQAARVASRYFGETAEHHDESPVRVIAQH
jgi:amino acid permease